MTRGGPDTPPDGEDPKGTSDDLGGADEAAGPSLAAEPPEPSHDASSSRLSGDPARLPEAAGPSLAAELPEPSDDAPSSRLSVDPARLSEDLALPGAESGPGRGDFEHRGSPSGGGGVERTTGSGTRPEGHTRRDPSHRRPGESAVGSDPLIGVVVFDRYRILRRIGSGGMGSVYVGEQLAVGREVALKVLRAELLSNEGVRQRFRREAEIIGRLSHPNTIQLIDYGETPDGLAVMVMELLRGRPLNERLKEEGPMDLLEVLDLGEQVARSLSEAHARGLVHRDLKPANIFLVDMGPKPLVKVLDFGIARLLDEEATRLTSTGQVFGTPRYMSPEQAISTSEVDARSDIYSLGLILYEGLVGQPPFVAQTSLQYLSAHTTQTPPKLRERYPAAPLALEALIDRCLEKDPALRPQTAEALADALAQIRWALEPTPLGASSGSTQTHGTLDGFSDTSTHLPSRHRSGRDGEDGRPTSGRRSRAMRWVSLGVLAALAAGVVIWLGRASGPSPVAPTELDGGSGALGLIGPPWDPELAPAEPSDAINGLSEPDAGSADAPAEEMEPPADEPPSRPAPRERRAERPRNEPDDHRPAPRRSPRESETPPRPRSGIVAEGRSMVIPGLADDLEAESDAALVERARRCRGHNSYADGAARLDTDKCPAGCIILAEERCAGRTPASGQPMAAGRREVAVVCLDRIVHSESVTFDDGATTRVTCR